MPRCRRFGDLSGGEVFYHGAEGSATPQTHSAAMLDLGGYYRFRDPGFQLLFCGGHSVAGQAETYAYLGLYRTWGKGEPLSAAPSRR